VLMCLHLGSELVWQWQWRATESSCRNFRPAGRSAEWPFQAPTSDSSWAYILIAWRRRGNYGSNIRLMPLQTVQITCSKLDKFYSSQKATEVRFSTITHDSYFT
jgi:hypothetical protein